MSRIILADFFDLDGEQPEPADYDRVMIRGMPQRIRVRRTQGEE
jgi:hypothetical protein